jgi:hypothetical protein
MDRHGHIDIEITKSDLEGICLTDYYRARHPPEIGLYYNEHNSSFWQMFGEAPQWIHDLADKVPQTFEHHVVSAIKLLPGHTIPLHTDKHYKLRQEFDVTGLRYRYLIFLEDWKNGHYVEINSEPVPKWKAGDWYMFSNMDWHLGGNMGLEPFYSAQVTAA